MKNNEILWENLTVLVGATLGASVVTAVLSIIFWNIGMFVSSIGLLVLSCVLDTVQANVNPERYSRGDF